MAGLVGEAQMVDMMLTGRIYAGAESVSIGLCQYLVEGASFDKAVEIARKAAQNPPLSNFAIISGISHISNMA